MTICCVFRTKMKCSLLLRDSQPGRRDKYELKRRIAVWKKQPCYRSKSQRAVWIKMALGAKGCSSVDKCMLRMDDDLGSTSRTDQPTKALGGHNRVEARLEKWRE